VGRAAVGVEEGGVDEAAAPAAGAPDPLERMLAQVARGTLPHAVEAVPGVEGGGALAERVEPRRRVDQVVDVVGRERTP
jgi:hypothetical protein